MSCDDHVHDNHFLLHYSPGLRGLMVAAALAAQMSTLTSIFNSASSMFTIDIWPYLRKNPSNNELMVVGRLTVMVLTGLGILWLPILQQSQGGQLWAYLQATAAYTAPPWTMVFLLGMFWKRTTEPVCFNLRLPCFLSSFRSLFNTCR